MDISHTPEPEKEQNFRITKKDNSNELLWSNGSYNEKTQRHISMNKQHNRMYQDKHMIDQPNQQFSSQNNTHISTMSGMDDLDTTVFQNETLANIHDEGSMLSIIQDQGFVKKNNKRDGQNEKLSSRHMMIQKGVRPFIDPNDYVKHLETENDFLRPKDSNYIE
jgi:hypothetical protein